MPATIAVDPSTPARVTKSGTASAVSTSAAFDPPASLLLFCGSGDLFGHSFTVSNSGTALTWTDIGIRNTGDSGGLNGTAQMAYAVLDTERVGMTVTATYSTANDTSFKLYVISGFDTDDPIGGQTEFSNTTTVVNTAVYATYPAQVAGSLAFIVLNDYNATGVMTSSDTTLDSGHISSQISFGSGYKSVGAVDEGVTHIITAGGNNPLLNWVAAEIRTQTATIGDESRVPVATIQIP